MNLKQNVLHYLQISYSVILHERLFSSIEQITHIDGQLLTGQNTAVSFWVLMKMHLFATWFYRKPEWPATSDSTAFSTNNIDTTTLAPTTSTLLLKHQQYRHYYFSTNNIDTT